MTANLATFAAAATVYFYVGSIHEESRLLATYGEPYRRYMESGVPFFAPALPARAAASSSPLRRDALVA